MKGDQNHPKDFLVIPSNWWWCCPCVLGRKLHHFVYSVANSHSWIKFWFQLVSLIRDRGEAFLLSPSALMLPNEIMTWKPLLCFQNHWKLSSSCYKYRLHQLSRNVPSELWFKQAVHNLYIKDVSWKHIAISSLLTKISLIMVKMRRLVSFMMSPKCLFRSACRQKE